MALLPKNKILKYSNNVKSSKIIKYKKCTSNCMVSCAINGKFDKW